MLVKKPTMLPSTCCYIKRFYEDAGCIHYRMIHRKEKASEILTVCRTPQRAFQKHGIMPATAAAATHSNISGMTCGANAGQHVSVFSSSAARSCRVMRC